MLMSLSFKQYALFRDVEAQIKVRYIPDLQQAFSDRKQALIVFARRRQAVTEKAPWTHTPPSWKLLVMTKQWGSCSPQGTLSINPHLVKAPTKCINYVLLHELCHLKEHNHSPEFYRLLSHQMPDWEAVKGKLDGMAELILNE